VRRYLSWILAFKFEDGALLLKVKEMEGMIPPAMGRVVKCGGLVRFLFVFLY
jgi:hypothetical protein